MKALLLHYIWWDDLSLAEVGAERQMRVWCWGGSRARVWRDVRTRPRIGVILGKGSSRKKCEETWLLRRLRKIFELREGRGILIYVLITKYWVPPNRILKVTFQCWVRTQKRKPYSRARVSKILQPEKLGFEIPRRASLPWHHFCSCQPGA